MKTIGRIFEDPKFVCPHCGKEYKTQENLDKHITKEHGEDKAAEE